MSLYFAPSISPSILTSLSVPAAEKYPQSMMLPQLPCFTVGIVPGFLQTWHQRVQSWFHQTREYCLCFLANSKRTVKCILPSSGFHLATLPWRPDWWSAAEMVFLLEGSPISTDKLWSSVSDHRVCGHLPDQEFWWFQTYFI
jgi:hypothetical protein